MSSIVSFAELFILQYISMNETSCIPKSKNGNNKQKFRPIIFSPDLSFLCPGWVRIKKDLN